VDAGGHIDLPKILFKNTWPMSDITAVIYTQNSKLADSHKVGEWNNYVRKLYKAAGAKFYITWVYDDRGNMIGAMTFYDNHTEEIKMKHFKRWNMLRKHIIMDQLSELPQ